MHLFRNEKEFHDFNRSMSNIFCVEYTETAYDNIEIENIPIVGEKNPEHAVIASEWMKAVWKTEKGRKLYTEAAKKRRQDPHSGYHKENFKNSMSFHSKKRMQDFLYRDNISKKVSSTVKELWKTEEYQKKNCERYIVTDPNGNSFEILNLNKFCRENNLTVGNMWAVSAGRRTSHKGWKCCKIAE